MRAAGYLSSICWFSCRSASICASLPAAKRSLWAAHRATLVRFAAVGIRLGHGLCPSSSRSRSWLCGPLAHSRHRQTDFFGHFLWRHSIVQVQHRDGPTDTGSRESSRSISARASLRSSLLAMAMRSRSASPGSSLRRDRLRSRFRHVGCHAIKQTPIPNRPKAAHAVAEARQRRPASHRPPRPRSLNMLRHRLRTIGPYLVKALRHRSPTRHSRAPIKHRSKSKVVTSHPHRLCAKSSRLPGSPARPTQKKRSTVLDAAALRD